VRPYLKNKLKAKRAEDVTQVVQPLSFKQKAEFTTTTIKKKKEYSFHYILSILPGHEQLFIVTMISSAPLLGLK
jgi:hypothetical protein